MSTKAITPEPSEWLRLLTGNRLQTQVSRSGVLDGGGAGSTMSGMEPTTTSRTTRPYPRTPDGKYKYTAGDGSPRYLEPDTIPSLVGPNFLIPASVTKFFRKLFRRTDTPAAR